MGNAARLASRLIRAFQGWNALRTEPLRALRSQSRQRGLDVGCGRGDLAATLMRQGWAMEGVEPSPGACALAQARGIDVLCGTLATVSLRADAYDFVLFRHSLEHTPDPIGALRSAAGALAPGGLLLVSVPNFGGHQARRFRGCWYHLDLPRHRVHFTADALAQALAAVGLEPVRISTSTSAMGLAASLQYRICGRCLFPHGLGLRVASGLCALTQPLAMLFDRDQGDTLHAVARRPG